MKLEAGDMIVCARDYGIVLKVEDPCTTISWFDKSNDHGQIERLGANTQVYRIDSLINAIDGEHNKLVKGRQ